MPESDRMREQLRREVLPYLRSLGFKGSLPHLRRVHEKGIDLLCFQFNKWGEPKLVLEYGYTGRFEPWSFGYGDMRTTTEKNVVVWDLDLGYRGRLNPMNTNAQNDYPEYWFSYEDRRYFECAKEILDCYPIAEKWFSNMRNSPENQDIGLTGLVAMKERKDRNSSNL
ncbi:MAG: DUF4304 domain-containing protein [Candidatus Obscuribacterales bacterium]|nr:DUF4304 domain-containing protein [Candidatus Obscuribacterales bacterium]